MSFCGPCLEGCFVWKALASRQAVDGAEPVVAAPPLTPRSSLIEGIPQGNALARRKELLQPAPPGQAAPDAWVTLDYPKNPKKLLVLIPSPNDPPGHWAKAENSPDSAGLGLPTAPRLLRWAERNGYAACLFAAEALEQDAEGAWIRVFTRNPSRSVYVLTAPGAVASFVACLKEEHPLSYSRIRSLVCTQPGEAQQAMLTAGTDVKAFLKRYVTADLTDQSKTAETFCQDCFTLFSGIEKKYQEDEFKKMGALAGLKEFDVPGLRRVPVDQRVSRINRDRDDDELSRLIKAAEEVD